MNSTGQIRSICIIGSGPSGIASYIALAYQRPAGLNSITLISSDEIENQRSFGAKAEDLLANTSASITSIDPFNESDYIEWLEEKKGYNTDSYDSVFTPRSFIGEYISDRTKRFAKILNDAGIETRFVIDTVFEVTVDLIVKVSSGDSYKFDAVICATGSEYGNPWPNFNGEKNYFPSPSFLGKEVNAKSALVAGSNLSAIDSSLRILRKNPGAKVLMASKSGCLPAVRRVLTSKSDCQTSGHLYCENNIRRLKKV
ncbi:MAG: FAD/NAD(P)-binding protein [Lautropia sp.]|nr:FAD/NAD(P)-binding protein [Lautropia sp.]